MQDLLNPAIKDQVAPRQTANTRDGDKVIHLSMMQDNVFNGDIGHTDLPRKYTKSKQDELTNPILMATKSFTRAMNGTRLRLAYAMRPTNRKEATSCGDFTHYQSPTGCCSVI